MLQMRSFLPSCNSMGSALMYEVRIKINLDEFPIPKSYFIATR